MKPAYVVIALLAVAGCGASAVETIVVPPQCPLPALQMPPEVPFLMINDLESGSFMGSKSAGMDAVWEFWRDETNPSPQQVRVANECAALGSHALHAFSQGPHQGWGASANLFFVGPPRPKPYDGQAWNAISFYMALGPTADSPRSIRVSVSTMETAWQGRCTSCVDNFGLAFELTSRWQRFVLPFSQLRQMGWGIPQTSLKLDQLVQFHIALDQQYDVWVDHVRFELLP